MKRSNSVLKKAPSTYACAPSAPGGYSANHPGFVFSDIFIAEHMDETRRSILSRLEVLESENRSLHRTNDLLEEDRDKYLAGYNHAPIGIFMLQRSGRILNANDLAAEIFEVEPKHLVGQLFSSLAVPEDQPAISSYIDAAFIEHVPVGLELRMALAGGKEIWSRLDAVVGQASDNGEELCFLTLRGISEQKRDKALLKQAHDDVERLKATLDAQDRRPDQEAHQKHSHRDIVGNSAALCAVLKLVEQVAPTDSRALILGETGVGKELLARSIHHLSHRRDRPMINVNCAALSPTLIESELFGRERGAFTGALSKQLGRFELAHRSTLFLDEIDGVPLDLQAKLLRVLECGEFERLGSPHVIKVDVRVIAASNIDLAGAVKEGLFRKDLFYRLNVFQINVPPLRERREDIMPLVWSFVELIGKQMGKRIRSIPQPSVDALVAYPWPGNIRELRNVIERAMITADGSVLRLDIPMFEQPQGLTSLSLDEMERGHIVDALKASGWRVGGKGGAADILGINPKTLGSRMVKHGIRRKGA